MITLGHIQYRINITGTVKFMFVKQHLCNANKLQSMHRAMKLFEIRGRRPSVQMFSEEPGDL